MEKEKVILYSMEACPACVLTKNFLDSYQVEYEVRDVRKDITARNELVKVYKQRSVPVCIIGENLIVGFREDLLRKYLNL